MKVAALTLCLFCTAIASGNDLFAWIDQDDRIVLQPREAELTVGGLEIRSEGGHLTAPSQPNPFLFFLSNTNEQITAGQLGTTATIPHGGLLWGEYDLSTALDVGLDPCNDLNVAIGWGPTPPSFPLMPGPPQPDPPSASFCATPGDVDFDGDVTFSDFLILSENFGMKGAAWPDGDFDWDQVVGFADFLALSANYEQSQPASSVPEPTAQLLALIVAAFCLTSRHPRSL